MEAEADLLIAGGRVKSVPIAPNIEEVTGFKSAPKYYRIKGILQDSRNITGLRNFTGLKGYYRIKEYYRIKGILEN